MTLTDQHRIARSTFEGHGVFEARYLGKAARESHLSRETFEALLKALVAAWLQAGYASEAVAAGEHSALAAYLNGGYAD
jgi:hypothetical protein